MNEKTLYEPKGKPVAYISQDNSNTIYLWTGEPVAYLSDENIYGFNGKHLGWFEQGILWDHRGHRVGFTKETLTNFAEFEPLKAFKSFKPFKAFKEFAPFKPFKTMNNSKLSLINFLKQGGK